MNIGIVVPHLGASQISFCTIKAVNKLIQEKYEDDVVIFFEHLISPILSIQSATLCVNELMSFKGHLICSTIDNATRALAMNTRKTNSIILYLWDLDWMRPGKNIYLYNYKALQEVNKIIVRSQNHAKAIENYANRQVNGVIENFDLKEIIKC